MPRPQDIIASYVGGKPVLGSFVGGALATGGGATGPFSTTGAYTAVIGDSIDAGSPAQFSWFDEACRLSGQRMRRYINAGVGGNTTTQMLARINTDVIAQSPVPNVCVIGGPTNDYSNAIAPATTQSNIQAMVAALRGAGITPVIRNCPSRNTAGTGAFNTVALVRQAILDHNAWLAGYCASEGIALVDIFTPTYDGAGLVAAYTGDGLHLNGPGCYAAASYAARRLPSYLNSAARPYLTTSKVDALNIITNGTFQDDVNADGFADNWGGTSTSAPSITPNTVDAIGNWQNFTTANGVTGILSPSGAVVTAIPLHVYELAALVKGEVGKIIRLRVQVRDVGSGNLLTIDPLLLWNVQAGGENQTVFFRFTAPATSTHMAFTYQGDTSGATGQMSIARLTIRDITANP